MKHLFIVTVAALLAGCLASENAPLFFRQAHIIDTSARTKAANQTPETTVGYKDTNIAHIPTVASMNDGSAKLIQGRVEANSRDTYSTFGQFEATEQSPNISLGKFFATGIAARRLSDGFSCEDLQETEKNCPQRPAVTNSR